MVNGDEVLRRQLSQWQCARQFSAPENSKDTAPQRHFPRFAITKPPFMPCKKRHEIKRRISQFEWKQIPLVLNLSKGARWAGLSRRLRQAQAERSFQTETLRISAVSIERFLKWGAVPLALVVAFFVSRYSDDIFGTSDTGLDATARARFDSTAQACLRAQNSDPASKAFSPVVIDQYCHCYANGMADRLSDDDLRALATMERSARARKMQPMVEAASAPCLKALPKAN